jgi:hypothetical protein
MIIRALIITLYSHYMSYLPRMYVGTLEYHVGVPDGVIRLGKVHSILEILRIQVGLIIIHMFLTM